jgi:CrcB protein
MLKAFLLVFLGGGAGSVLRYAVGRATAYLCSSPFPWGTFIVNVLGSFAAGFLMGWLATRETGHAAGPQLLLMTGFLGGFTTFSAFSVEAVALASRDQTSAAGYVVATLLLTLVPAAGGLWLARAIWRTSTFG